ncbi:cytochrome c oxidase assembly protein [Pseudomonas tremae]|uniref:cytochrome c oxidase assembly protein n=1 Tax=Pseudomonas syringae group TaxID=136849 RepID=UPI0006D608B7|nr:MULTISPECIES: cytochrome c oxidase assembly protein [Pseudomonas syringae group]KPW31751.1 Cytochrome C oxidase assembly protein [Pseudomonas coronafaciens pv. atropurpurea]MCF5711493.1 cytochrome c oxidase assembly protein [Pseudomonas tremae]MCF5746792.1 cytochrome c oxidase assembly protein [Pseudomonas tremae]MCQ2988023.1 cytochrome c oxidase assembly protein [Pseudomonas tremae]RMP25190.1 Cytochrome C oxidase assembly protein [Pseudomonas coronafaciens pv. atropurpurea]
MTRSVSRSRFAGRLILLLIIMFTCGYALPPLYDWLIRAVSGHDKTADAYSQPIDAARQVEVRFAATTAAGMVWQFYPRAGQMIVHPGAVNEMTFIAQNPTDKPMKAQAIPGISPGKAAAWFHKTECFCFTQQTLQPGERIEMPVRFIVDRDLPADVRQLTLAYTLLDVTTP